MDELKIIAHIHTDFPEKFGIPRQSGLVKGLVGRIVFEPEYRNPDALKGIGAFSHLWLLWKFENVETDSFRATVRPPRLGGNETMGVFATRSPFRPNPIGLSSVKLEGIEDTPQGKVLIVSGVDLRDNSSIYDIKPYLSYTDSHPEATNGFGGEHVGDNLSVECSEDMLSVIPENKRQALLEVLGQDPRPHYQDDPDREYGFFFGQYNVKFKVNGKTLRVIGIDGGLL